MLMNLGTKEVLIFKAPSVGVHNENDPYKKKFEEYGFSTVSIAVLHFEYTNLEVLLQHLRSPKQFSGIVFTSPRAVQATACCLKDAGPVLEAWRDRRTFVIGETTARLAEEQLELTGQGSHAGNADELAQFILGQPFLVSGKCAGPLLFPCGSTKRDVLQTKLHQGGVEVVPVTVYRTLVHPHLEQQLREVAGRHSFPQLLVYFSPSAVGFTFPVLKSLHVPLQHIKFVAIGPATEEALKEAQVHVWAVAPRPTPHDLVEAVANKYLS